MRTVLACLLAVGMVGTAMAGTYEVPTIANAPKLLQSEEPLALVGQVPRAVQPVSDPVCYIDDYLPGQITGTPAEVRKAQIHSAWIVQWAQQKGCVPRGTLANP